MGNTYEEIVNLLRKNNACYKETVHQPVYTSEQAAKAIDVLENQIAKSLLLKCGDDFVLAVLPGARSIVPTAKGGHSEEAIPDFYNYLSLNFK